MRRGIAGLDGLARGQRGPAAGGEDGAVAGDRGGVTAERRDRRQVRRGTGERLREGHRQPLGRRVERPGLRGHASRRHAQGDLTADAGVGIRHLGGGDRRCERGGEGLAPCRVGAAVEPDGGEPAGFVEGEQLGGLVRAERRRGVDQRRRQSRHQRARAGGGRDRGPLERRRRRRARFDHGRAGAGRQHEQGEGRNGNGDTHGEPRGDVTGPARVAAGAKSGRRSHGRRDTTTA